MASLLKASGVGTYGELVKKCKAKLDNKDSLTGRYAACRIVMLPEEKEDNFVASKGFSNAAFVNKATH